MKCAKTKILIDEFIHDRLTPELRDELKKHLESCPECQKLYELENWWSDLLKRDKVPDPGESYWGSFEDRVIRRRDERSDELTLSKSPKYKSKTSELVGYLIPLAASFVIFIGMLGLSIDGTQEKKIATTNNPAELVNEKLCLEEKPRTEYVRSILLSPPGGAGYHMALAFIKKESKRAG